MKFVLLALLGVSAVSAFAVKSQESLLAEFKNRVITPEAEMLTGEALVDYVNSQQKLWTAQSSKFTMEKMLAKLMDEKYTQQVADAEIAPEIQLDTIPDTFDARKEWPHCPSISYIRDQSDCGACWSFGAAEVMSDRTCIASKGKVAPILSADDILSCCGSSCGNGCQGGYPIYAFKFWNSHGVCTGANYGDKNTCKPYPIAPCGQHQGEPYYGPCPTKEYATPKCTDSCLNSAYKTSYTADKHFGKSAYGVAKTVSAIQKEIMTNGPVEAAYTVYEDFYQYKSGVYVHTAGKKLGGHAVRILGWGVEGGNPYWLVANSWNTDWGENGYFKILRGVNECGIEDAIVAGLAKV